MPVWQLKTPTTAQGGVLVAGKTIKEIIQKGNCIKIKTLIYIV